MLQVSLFQPGIFADVKTPQLYQELSNYPAKADMVGDLGLNLILKLIAHNNGWQGLNPITSSQVLAEERYIKSQGYSLEFFIRTS